MTASHERAQRASSPSGVSLVSVSGDSVLGRADDLDAEAVYYRHRAIQEEQALGPGCYVDLLRDMATDRAARAQRIRAQNGAT